MHLGQGYFIWILLTYDIIIYGYRVYVINTYIHLISIHKLSFGSVMCVRGPDYAPHQ